MSARVASLLRFFFILFSLSLFVGVWLVWFSGLAAGSGFHTGFVCFVVFILRQRAGRWLSCGSRTGGLSKDT